MNNKSVLMAFALSVSLVFSMNGCSAASSDSTDSDSYSSSDSSSGTSSVSTETTSDEAREYIEETLNLANNDEQA